jgi:cytochrome c2
MTESGFRWDETTLRVFLAAPAKTVPGTIMPPSIDDPQQIDDLIAYLKTLR